MEYKFLYRDEKGLDHYSVRPEPDSKELWDCVELPDGTLRPIKPLEEER